MARRPAAAVARVIDLCRRALIGTQLPGPVWTPILAVVIGGIFVSGLVLPRAANAGVLVVLPVLAAAWMLRCRYVAAVVCLALASQLVSAAAGVANPVLVGASMVTIVAVAGVSRLGALSWGELRLARRHDVGALIEASQRVGRSLDLAGVGAEAVRTVAGCVMPSSRPGGRRAALLRVVEGRVVVVAACDETGRTLRPAAEIPLIEMPLCLHETLRSGRTTVAGAADTPPGLRELVLGADAAAWAMARVQVASEPFGVLTLAGSRPAEFGRDDLRLLDGITRVTGLAVATAVRHAELAELERRLQDSVGLALEVGSSLEPNQVVASILERLAESGRADRVTLASLDGGTLVVEATYRPSGGGPPLPVGRQFGPESVEAIPLLAHALAAGQPMTCGPLGATLNDRGLAAALADGRHTLIFPFVMSGHAMSVLVLGRREEPFDETDMVRLGPMADVALVALRNARLYAEAERAKLAASRYSDRLQLAIEAAEDIGSSQELSEVLERVLRRAVAVVRATRGSVSRLEDDAMVIEHDHDPSGHQVPTGLRWALRHSAVAAEAIRVRRPIFGRLPGREPLTPEMRSFLEATQARHVIHCPLLVGREVVGLLGLSRRGDEGFGEADVLALRPFATLAGLLIRNARLLEEARRVGKAKSAFLNLAAHELRTPLAVIKGYLSLLDDGTYAVPERTRVEAIQTLIAKAQELETLVEALLTTARLEVGLPHAPTDFDLCEAVRQAAGRVGPRARLERASVELRLPAGAVLARADRGHVGRILDNLLNNALTYSERPASVTVTVRDGDRVVAVADRGLGIPSEQHGRVFERFHRIERTGSRFTPGLGLGLSISRELAQTNGGALVLEASAPGEGSVFVLRLPSPARVGSPEELPPPLWGRAGVGGTTLSKQSPPPNLPHEGGGAK